MKLTDTQLIVLNKAAQRSTMLALPLPPNLKGGAAHKVVKPLIEKGLLEEIDANFRAGETVWRKTGSGHGVTLVITEAGLAAIGIEPEKPKSKGAPRVVASKAPTKAAQAAAGAKKVKAAKTAAGAKKPARKTPPAVTAPKPREGTKQAIMIAMLQRKTGATIVEIVAETGWQPHTVRGAFAGALKKKLGLTIVREGGRLGARLPRGMIRLQTRRAGARRLAMRLSKSGGSDLDAPVLSFETVRDRVTANHKHCNGTPRISKFEEV